VLDILAAAVVASGLAEKVRLQVLFDYIPMITPPAVAERLRFEASSDRSGFQHSRPTRR